jgi:hypothetical protein
MHQSNKARGRANEQQMTREVNPFQLVHGWLLSNRQEFRPSLTLAFFGFRLTTEIQRKTDDMNVLAYVNDTQILERSFLISLDDPLRAGIFGIHNCNTP